MSTVSNTAPNSDAGAILEAATIEQVRWVLARLTARSDAEAARCVGLAKGTVSRWPNKGDLDLAVSFLLRSHIEGAQRILADSAIEAASVIVAGLHDRRKAARLDAANNILDRLGVGARGGVQVELPIMVRMDR